MNESVNGSIEVVALPLPMFIWVTPRRMFMSLGCKPKTDENPEKIQLSPALVHIDGDDAPARFMLKKRLPF